MSAPELLGTNSLTLEQFGYTPGTLAFSSWVDSLFEPVGFNGCPDPGSDPYGAFRYINNRRDVIKGSANQKPLIQLADNNLNVLAPLTGEITCSAEELMADAGQCKLVILIDNWLENYMINETSVNQDLHILIDPIPTYPMVNGVPQDWQIRWGGKIKELSLIENEDGTGTIEILAISHREHAKHLLFGATPWFAPEIQPLQMWVLPGPLRSILFATGVINLARLFVPGLSAITNAFNPASWLNPLSPDALLNLNPLSWPIQCAFVNPVLDTSMWSVLAATWTDWHSTMADLLSNAGCICRAYTWLTTDATSPHTELTDLITGSTTIGVDLLQILGVSTTSELSQSITAAGGDIADLARPTRNCVVLSFEDKSGVVGPTGTAIDGLLSTIGVTLDDLITSVIFDQQSETFVSGQEIIDVNQTTPFFTTLAGVETLVPQVVWREGQFTGMIRREVNLHKAPPLAMMVGGRSPTIVNQLQTFGIRFGLAELSYVPTLWGGADSPLGVGGPNNLSPEIPFTPGLDNIYQGQLDNILLAWERYTDPLRSLWTGDMAYQEYIERGTTSAYTVAGWLSLAEAHWKTRAFYGFQTKAMNGFPWVYGIDFKLGDRIGFELDSIIYVDQLAAVKWDYSRTAPIFLYISVGDDRDKHDPIAAGMRTLQGVYTVVGAYLGEGTLFG